MLFSCKRKLDGGKSCLWDSFYIEEELCQAAKGG